MIKKVIALIVVLLLTALLVGGYMASRLNQQMAHRHTLPNVISLDLARGSTLGTLARWLKQNAFIDDERMFRIWLKLNQVNPVIKAGYYEFSGAQSVESILSDVENGNVVSYEFAIIEGTTVNEVLQRLSMVETLESSTLSEEAVLSSLNISQPRLEGLLYPDTYRFNRGDTALSLLGRAHQRLNDELARVWAMAAKGGQLKTPYEALILASIIEKETAAEHERSLISGVFHNRLRIGMRLQTDPTVIYGIGSRYDGNITKAHLRTDTPYNTYMRAGLPPTPIAFVGRAALEAAVQPQKTDALYFVATGTNGEHYFSSSLGEHNRAVRKYILKR